MPAPDRDSKASPERHPQPIATAALALWPQAAGASLTKSDLATAPRVLHSPDPASERGFAPGTLIIGSAPSLYQVGSDGVPVSISAGLASHVDGGANKHDATEIDYELADGSKKVIAAASDTVEAALTDLDTYLGAQLDKFVMAVIAVADATGGTTDSLLTLQLYRLDGTTPIASARQVAIRFTSTLYSGTADNSPTLGTVTTGSVITSLAGLFLVETDATGAFACTVTNTTDETLYAVAVTSVGGVSTLAKAAVVVGCVPDAVTWSA